MTDTRSDEELVETVESVFYDDCDATEASIALGELSRRLSEAREQVRSEFENRRTILHSRDQVQAATTLALNVERNARKEWERGFDTAIDLLAFTRIMPSDVDSIVADEGHAYRAENWRDYVRHLLAVRDTRDPEERRDEAGEKE